MASGSQAVRTFYAFYIFINLQNRNDGPHMINVFNFKFQL